MFSLRKQRSDFTLFFFIVCIGLLHIGTALGQTQRSGAIVGDPDLDRYPFKPGDGVAINAFPDTTSFLNNVFPIDDRGFAEFPIVGKVKVSAMTGDELTNYLRETFKAWLRNPNIYVKPVVRVSLLGGFARPGLYYVDYTSTLWDVVRLAGGPVLEEGIYDMRWERGGKKRKGNLTQYFESGISLKRMGFQSGDQLRTPPEVETFWDQFRTDIIPLVTFATSMALLYYTYQRDTYLMRSGRRF
jgi:protein involved in polysaccharide export with SLBB domain